VTNYVNHKETERRQEGLRIHRTHVGGGGGERKAWGFLGWEIIKERHNLEGRRLD